MGKMKLRNGLGSVYQLKGKRKKPFAVRITKGWDTNGKQIRQIIDYAETSEEGFRILIDYWQDPYDIDLSKITFNEVFDKLIRNLEIKEHSGVVSKKTVSRYRSAYPYYKTCQNKPFMEVSRYDIQNAVNNCEHGYHTKLNIKLLYNKMYEYSLNELGMPLKRNVATNLFIGVEEKSNMHKPFTADEIKTLWKVSETNFTAKEVLVMIYEGLRPTEYLKINKDKVFYEDNYFIGGIKTKSGIDRIIPLNNEVKSFILEFLDNKEIGRSYQRFNARFEKLMKELAMDHKPHDCRHTFATTMRNLKADPLHIKLIMGHKVEDITENVYTHIKTEDLIKTINLFKKIT